MDRTRFRDWFSSIDELTAEQCRKGERVRGAVHNPDGQQPSQPDQGLPATLPRHRHQVSRQLSEVVPSRRPRQASIAKSLPRNR